MKPDPSLLAEQRLFRALPERALAALAAAGTIARYEVGGFVFHEGERRPARLYVLLSGCLQVSKLARSGKETVLRLIHAGEMFGSLMLFGEPAMPASALVLEEATVFSLDRDELLRLSREEPELSLALLQALGERLREVQDRLHAMASERAPNRLAQILLHEARKEGIVPGQEMRERLSYKMLAQMCGITYEETVRIMRTWASAGYLDYRRGGRLVLLDRDRLEQLAAGHID